MRNRKSRKVIAEKPISIKPSNTKSEGEQDIDTGDKPVPRLNEKNLFDEPHNSKTVFLPPKGKLSHVRTTDKQIQPASEDKVAQKDEQGNEDRARPKEEKEKARNENDLKHQ